MWSMVVGAVLFVAVIGVVVYNISHARRHTAWEIVSVETKKVAFVCTVCTACSTDMHACSECGSMYLQEEITAVCTRCDRTTPESQVHEWGSEAGTCTCKRCVPRMVLTLVH